MRMDSFRLLQLLRPQEFPDDMSFEERLASGTPLPPCTSSTRRTDIGGLPPRVGIPISLDDRCGVEASATESSRHCEAAKAANAVAQRKKIDRVRRALASGAALKRRARTRRTVAARAGRCNGCRRPAPRVAAVTGDRLEGGRTRRRWCSWPTAKRWRCCARRSAIARNWPAVSFHEELSPARRDTEVALFRDPDGPSLLVSTESGGEGRNFEFCRRLVLFDLPWKPSTVEQRIGRLDRIGRRIPVEIVYFNPPSGLGSDVVRLLEALDVFTRAVRRSRAATGARGRHTRGDRARPEGGTFRRTSRDPDRRRARRPHANPGSGLPAAASRPLPIGDGRPDLLARIPAELDALNEKVVVTVCARLGFTIEHTRRTTNVRDRAGERGARGQPPGRSWWLELTSARSIARKRSKTSQSTSSRRGIRSSKESLLTSRTARSAVSFDSKSRLDGTVAGARGDLQGGPRVRGRRARLRRPRSSRLGRSLSSAAVPRAPRGRWPDR